VYYIYIYILLEFFLLILCPLSDFVLLALGGFNIGQKGGARLTKILPAKQTNLWEFFFERPSGKIHVRKKKTPNENRSLFWKFDNCFTAQSHPNSLRQLLPIPTRVQGGGGGAIIIPCRVGFGMMSMEQWNYNISNGCLFGWASPNTPDIIYRST